MSATPRNIGCPLHISLTTPRVLSLPWLPWWFTHVSPSTCLPNPPGQTVLCQSYLAYGLALFRSYLKAWVLVRRAMIGLPAFR